MTVGVEFVVARVVGAKGREHSMGVVNYFRRYVMSPRQANTY